MKKAMLSTLAWAAFAFAAAGAVQAHDRGEQWTLANEYPANSLSGEGDAYFARLVECLADDYPCVQYALGEDRFEEIARRYIEAHPSSSPSLNWFGRGFEQFAREQDDLEQGIAGIGRRSREDELGEEERAEQSEQIGEEKEPSDQPAAMADDRRLPAAVGDLERTFPDDRLERLAFGGHVDDRRYGSFGQAVGQPTRSSARCSAGP